MNFKSKQNKIAIIFPLTCIALSWVFSLNFLPQRSIQSLDDVGTLALVSKYQPKKRKRKGLTP